MLEAINEITMPILLIALPVLVGALTAYTLELWKTQKAKLSKEQYALLSWSAKTIVWGIEQAYKDGAIKKNMRLETATDYLQKKADQLGLKISLTEIVNLIEAAVGKELNARKITMPK